MQASGALGGPVVLWGSAESQSPSGARKRGGVGEVAERFGVPAIAHREPKAVAAAHGLSLQGSVRPPRSLATVGTYHPSSVRAKAMSAALGSGRERAAGDSKGGLHLSQAP